uniref:F-box domain-containing protein n=1 Tax=Parastrongyloides trichosuri TaxID=131310 RepID=A0A0N4ZMS3_PARTI
MHLQFNQILRRFDLRKKTKKFDKSRSSSINSLASIETRTSGFGSMGSIESLNYNCEQYLPNNIIFKILDYEDNTFQLVKLRAISKDIKSYVDQRLSYFHFMDIKKGNIESVVRTSYSCGNWYYNNYKNLALRISRRAKITPNQNINCVPYMLEVIVDDQWSSTDVNRLLSLLTFFRKYPKQLILDAPIVELIVVSLSSMDINRWYAFQCFMKITNDYEMRMSSINGKMKRSNTYINNVNSFVKRNEYLNNEKQNNDKKSIFWTLVSKFTIRISERQEGHLLRLIDYNVKMDRVFNKDVLDKIKIQINDESLNLPKNSTSSESSIYSNASEISLSNHPFSSNSIKRGVFNFRCWAGSCGFDSQFCQIITSSL